MVAVEDDPSALFESIAPRMFACFGREPSVAEMIDADIAAGIYSEDDGAGSGTPTASEIASWERRTGRTYVPPSPSECSSMDVNDTAAAETGGVFADEALASSSH